MSERNLKNIIGSDRKVREDLNEEGLCARGVLTGFDDFEERAWVVINELESEFSEWIREQREDLGDLLEGKESKVQESFEKGIRVHLKRIFKMYRGVGLGSAEEEKDFLRDTIRAFVSDFVFNLRLEKREGNVLRSSVLKKGSQISYYPPTIEERISQEEEFKDLQDWVIRNAAVHNSSDPRGFLRKWQKEGGS